MELLVISVFTGVVFVYDNSVLPVNLFCRKVVTEQEKRKENLQ